MNQEIISNPKNSMRGWYSTSEEIRKALRANRMLNPMLDLSNACNLNCPYCYIEEKNSMRKKRLPHELSLKETIAVIDMCYLLGAKSIDLVGAGEPTIDPHFTEIVEHIHSLGLVTTLFTNGIKIAHDLDFSKFLFDRNVTVVMKMNTPDNVLQDLVAGKKGYASNINEAMLKLVRLGFNKPIPTRLSVNTIAFKGNLKELPAMHRYCREQNIFPMTGEFIPTGRTEAGEFVAEKALAGFTDAERIAIEQALRPLDANDRAWLRTMILEIDTEFGIVHTGCPSYYGGSACTQMLGLYIDIVGNIWPCVARSKKIGGKIEAGLLGNIRSDGVEKIKTAWLEHPYLIAMRKNYTGGCPYKAPL